MTPMRRRPLRSAAVFSILLAAALAAGCRPAGAVANAPQASLKVFAAASLKESFEAMAEIFEPAHPGASVVFNFAGSQQLVQQIGQGAPADVFASANARQMAAAVESGRVVSGTQRVFARNRLVVILPDDNPAGARQLQDLAKPGLRLVLAAREVPAGQYALEFLDKAAADPAFGAVFREDVLKNARSFEENVRAVLAKVSLGEADAGIVYVSDAAAAPDVARLAIPDALNVIAAYPIAALGDSPNLALAEAFVDFVLSETGQRILADRGFLPAGDR